MQEITFKYESFVFKWEKTCVCLVCSINVSYSKYLNNKKKYITLNWW